MREGKHSSMEKLTGLIYLVVTNATEVHYCDLRVNILSTMITPPNFFYNSFHSICEEREHALKCCVNAKGVQEDLKAFFSHISPAMNMGGNDDM